MEASLRGGRRVEEPYVNAPPLRGQARSGSVSVSKKSAFARMGLALPEHRVRQAMSAPAGLLCRIAGHRFRRILPELNPSVRRVHVHHAWPVLIDLRLLDLGVRDDDNQISGVHKVCAAP